MKIAAPSKAIELMEWKSQCKKYFKDYLFDRDDLNVAQVFSPGIITQARIKKELKPKSQNRSKWNPKKENIRRRLKQKINKLRKDQLTMIKSSGANNILAQASTYPHVVPPGGMLCGQRKSLYGVD
jgi:hypothetical protein